LDFSEELLQHAEILSLMGILVDYCHVVQSDKSSGHYASYYVRNTSIKMKTRCKKRVFTIFSLFSCQNFWGI